MIGERRVFQTLNLKEGGSVGFGGNQKWKIISTCTIGNSSILIDNVWLLDGLKHNLMRISQFCDRGYEEVFNKNNCIVMNESYKSIVFKCRRKDNVYKISSF